MKIKILDWLAMLLGVSIRINSLPYGASLTRRDTD
jgi:hypothetical protein